jgi:hypothetical protein
MVVQNVPRRDFMPLDPRIGAHGALIDWIRT